MTLATHSASHEAPPAIILCGGQGTRIRDVTEMLPKPMVPVGPQPIVWHIMKTYAAFGVRRFILCLGYKREAFIDYFLNYRSRATDLTVKLGQNEVVYHGDHCEDDWEVTLADTGEDTMTGGRVARAARHLKPEDKHCFMTYGDGLADLDIGALYQQHLRKDKSLTISVVSPRSRFGEVDIHDGDVRSFKEKPQVDDGFINGGYMVLKREFINRYLSTDSSLVFEKDPMCTAAKNGDMAAYTHRGFWECMDTAREHQMLNKLWDSGAAPWTSAWAPANSQQKKAA